MNRDTLVELHIDTRELERAARSLARFSAGAANQVAARAINKTLTGVRTDTVREIGRIITPKAKVIRSHIHIFRANPSAPSGEVTAKGEPLGLIHYKARQTARGVTVQVLKKNPRKLIPHAYIRASWARAGRSGAWVEGGKNVFRRDFHGKHAGARKTKRKDIPWAKLPEKYRLPVSRLAGPRVPDIMSNEPVMARIQEQAVERLIKNWDHEIAWKLKKLMK